MTVKTSPREPTSLQTFFIIWGGQLVSTIGSNMTSFAIAIWAWELTGKATPLSLILFFTQTPTVIAACFAGILVDRWNRKQLMIVGDAIAALSTIAILLLLLNNNLQIWHLYVTTAINGLFGYFQSLAYSASMSTIVPKQHYARCSAMSSLKLASSVILGPALAGAFYPIISLKGILLIDVITCIIAGTTLLLVHIPQPSIPKIENFSDNKILPELTFGFRYIFARPSLLALLTFLLTNNFVDKVGMAVFSSMILARTNNNPEILASVNIAFGVGASIGAMMFSIWGGPKLRIHGILIGTGVTQFAKILFSLAREPLIWIVTATSGGFFMPWLGSCNQAIWLSKVEPGIQGRIFASRFLIAQITTPLGLGISGPLADNIFEPAMETGGSLANIFGGLFGTGAGAGMALQIALFSGLGIVICLCGYSFHNLRNVEFILPDHDS
ncbi:MFS transporter [Dapis sp. BLCC M126]|uniref:MFS transporter n=1 Tax=Dapis sp. BLCC M126 TaxID=3400189 RepID=UPI003CF1B674